MELCPRAEAVNDTWLCAVTGGWTRGGGSPEEDGQWVLPPLVGSTRRCRGSNNTLPLHNHTHTHSSSPLDALPACTEAMLTWPVVPHLHREADVTCLLVTMELNVPTAIC